MTIRISPRGKGYLETARTLLRIAQTMTDEAIANRLEALACVYQGRAESASHADAARSLARAAAHAESGWRRETVGRMVHPAGPAVPGSLKDF